MAPLISFHSNSSFFSSCSSGLIPLLFAFVVADLQTRSFSVALVAQSLLFAPDRSGAVCGVLGASTYPPAKNLLHAVNS